MRRYLIVANQTLGGEKLNATVRERIERGDSDFHILVPMTPPHQETESSAGSVAYEGMSADEARQWVEQDNERRAAAIESARSLAEQRLTQMIQTIESAGARAEGTICDANPIDAVKEAAGEGVRRGHYLDPAHAALALAQDGRAEPRRAGDPHPGDHDQGTGVGQAKQQPGGGGGPRQR